MSTFLLLAKAAGSAEAAENTCEAVSRVAALACSAGLEIGIEVDLRLSAEAELVALHDEYLERTTNGRGRVREHAARELCRLTAGSNGERVPTLWQVLDAAGDRPLLLDLHDDDAVAAAALCRALSGISPHRRERIWVASEHSHVIDAVRRMDRGLRTAATKREAWARLLLGRVGLGRLSPRGHVWIVPEQHASLKVITPRFVEQARIAGDPVWAFVIDDAAALERLRSWGVAACLTTKPAELAAAARR